MSRRTVVEQKTYLDTGFHRVARAMHAVDRPVLAAVQGPAVGAGVDLCCFADLRFAGPGASFFVRYSELGLVMGDGAAWHLPRIVGLPRALELAWSAAPVTAQRALDIGLVNAVHAPDELLPAIVAEAHRLAGLPPFAVRTTKRLLRQAAELPLDIALELSSSQQALAHATDDRQHAAALLASRPRRPDAQPRTT
jgi:enoyl-CoA hydratase/carnithine racemase